VRGRRCKRRKRWCQGWWGEEREEKCKGRGKRRRGLNRF
jgi:hypothetical protein